MIYTIIFFVLLVFIAYIMGITIVSLIDKHLSNISINLPKQNIIVKLPKDENENKIDESPKSEQLPGYEYENFSPWIHSNYKNTSICYKNHLHKLCNHGDKNYPDPETMSPIDKRYFKYNFQKNMTLQDYINWLWLYDKSEEELPYDHLKNLNKLKKGKNIDKISQIDLQFPKNSEDYYKKIYDSINLSKPLNLDHKYEGYNYNQYPTPISKN